MKQERTTVAIVGAGPAGLSAAILLARRGIDSVVLERRATTSHLPRAHLINVRTMEAFWDMGVADDVYALSPPEDRWHRVGWWTSLSGETELHGREIGHVQAWGGGTDAPRYAQASPRRFANVPQMRLDPLLRDHATAYARAGLRYHHEVTSLEHDDDGATLTVHDRDADRTYLLRARYAIVADGGRTCAEQLGVTMEGPTGLLDIVSQHVTMDLRDWVKDDQVLLTYFINPDGHGSFAGGLCAMGPDEWGRDSREWALHLAFPVGDPKADDRDLLLARARRMLGIPDLEITVHSVSHWQFEGVVADRFRVGPVFLVGNAAHRHPPTGGLGLNAAVQDVHNLVWKLELVLDGRAPDSLLESYERERRPINELYVRHSLENADGHGRVARALGLRAGQSEAEGWAEIAVWAADTSEGARRRAAVADAVASNADDYSQLNVEAGFAYDDGAIVPDGSPPPATHGSTRDFTPSARPGHHLPHVLLQRADEAISTVDLVDHRRFALFVGGEVADAWRSAAAELPVAIDVLAVGPGGEYRDASGAWAAVSGLAPTGALLVRPDRHVAWRTPSSDGDRARLLHDALDVVLHGGPMTVTETERAA
jgi:2,4-dichlorophenol 6-monooxygenase